MKHSFLILLLGVMFLITGCPLQVEQPVDEGSYTGTSWIEGKWVQQKSDGSTGKTYLIKRDKPGRLLAFTVSGGQPEAKGRPIVASTVGSRIFLSAYDEGDDVDDKGYYIFQLIKKNNSEFDLLPVKEHSVSSGASSKEVKDYLMQHQNDAIYEESERESYKKLK
jgi:hypothetical protein